ncbi:MAG: bifunctional folylpolyglutamate synthase/dihydrofolate synthase, partial [Bacteroidetes bacterium]|nr:bifunctional folylpolyglutamate synthase/dihydrofolate synthase [Bacteroidota bacterium]
TLAKIAAEKAGIIKPGVPVVIGEYGNESFPVFSAYADDQSSPLIRAWEIQEQLPNSDLKGPYQTANRRTALVAIRELIHGGWSIPESAIISGFEQVISNTGLMGRWQTIAEHPRIICDTGHNKDGIAYIVQQLKQESYQSLRMVFGQVAGKDPQAVLSMLPTHAEYYFCEPSVPRKLDVATLMEEAQYHQLNGRGFLSVRAAYEQALADSHADDLIFVGGSTFVVADLLTYLNHTDPVG